jgi:hypothetical protein
MTPPAAPTRSVFEAPGELHPFDKWMPFLSSSEVLRLSDSEVRPLRSLTVRISSTAPLAIKAIEDAMTANGFQKDSGARIQSSSTQAQDLSRAFKTDEGTLFVFATPVFPDGCVVAFQLYWTNPPPKS